MRCVATIRGRVALAALCAVAVTLAIVFVVVMSSFASSERGALDHRARKTLEAALASDRVGPGGAPPWHLRRVAIREGHGIILVADPGGQVIDRLGLADHEPDLTPADSDQTPRTVSAGGRHFRRVAQTGNVIVGPGETRRARVTVFAPSDATESRIEDLRTRVLVIGAAGLLLAGVLATALTRLALRRLEELRRESERVASPGSGRMGRGGPREVDALAAALNAMLDRLAEAEAERNAVLEASRRFAADAGHELRTPLATMGAELGSLGDHGRLRGAAAESLDAIVAQHARMRALLEALQALARGDAGATIEHIPVDVSQLLDAAAEAAGARHPGTAFSVDAASGAPTLLEGWPEGLRLAVDNLLDNAARHGGPHVRVAEERGDGHLDIVVEDDGPGIAVDEREAVVERFTRGSGATGPGSGLGLALVAQQAVLHDGELRLEERRGGGARIVLRLAMRGDHRPPPPVVDE